MLRTLVKGIDSLFGDLNVVRGFPARNILLGVRRGQVQPGVQQAGVVRNRVLKMHDGGLELRVAIRRDALVELVPRP